MTDRRKAFLVYLDCLNRSSGKGKLPIVGRMLAPLLLRFLRKAKAGRLRLIAPDQKSYDFGPARSPGAVIRVLDWNFFWRVAWAGDIGLGDGHTEGEWESDDLTAVVCFFLENRDYLDDKNYAWTRYFGRIWAWALHRVRRNSIQGSKRNIEAHYDLGNQLYSSFLGESMSYSCAFFDDPNADLQQAQLRKMDALLERARLDSSCHLLEIGSGWGGLSIRAAQRYGCRVTGVTLSAEQLEWSRRSLSGSGVEDRVEFLLTDYRELQGKYDRAISCEMLEAVGHENLPVFFGVLERVLRPEGLAVLQVITVPDFSYEVYRRNPDWIQKEIFPGAVCPSVSALLAAASSSSRWVLEELRNIGPHYGRTLREWRENFEQSWPKLLAAGYSERFRKAWLYYLSYCEAAFVTRNLADVQIVLTRPKNPLLLSTDPPWLSLCGEFGCRAPS